MKRIWTVFLILCLTFSLGATAFAAENESQDVYAKYIEADTNGAEAPVEGGKVEVELPDGTEVEVGDLLEDVKTVEVVPIPQDEAEAIEWFEDVIEGDGTEPQPYIILVTDKDGNEENANGVTVTMDIPEGINDPIVVAVDSDGTKTELPATVKDGKITFEADGSDFYVIVEKKVVTGITVPVRGDENEIHADATINGDTVELHELDFEEIDHIVGDHVNTGIVEIDLTELDKEITKIELPMASIKHIVEAAEEAHNDTEALQIDFPNGSVKLDDKALRAIIDTVGEETTATLVLESVGTDRLNDTQEKALEGKNVYGGFEAYLICNKTGVRVSDFKGGVATLSVPFTVPNGLKAEKFSVWYVADDGKIEKLETWHEDGKLHWSVGHFSDFIIVYEGDETPDAPVNPPSTGDDTMIWPWILLAIAACGIIFFLIFWKRRKKDEEEKQMNIQ